VSGGQRHRLVVEEQHREVVRLPLRQPPVAVLQRAGDPEPVPVERDDLLALVEDAAVAEPGATQVDGHDVAVRA
jgi:hypothetical protein